MFRTRTRGFCKEDVNEYVVRMNEEIQRLQQESRQREELLCAQKEELEQECRRLQAENELLTNTRQEMEGQNQRMDTLDEELKELQQQLQREREEAAHREATLNVELESLRLGMQQARQEADLLREKAARYDASCAEVGDIVLNARKQSDALIAEAGERAAAVMEGAKARRRRQ